MDIDKLHHASQRPGLYEKGDSVMWTDKHISAKLLELHINPQVDSASRSQESIARTIDFIKSFCERPGMNVLDLGCGPGLYLEQLAELGHSCTGVDFSGNSISYARSKASEKGLDINYLVQDYLDLDYTNHFDLIILIYTDLGVLLPEEREKLLSKVYRALKPDGIFIFDVLNERNLEEKFQEEQSWAFEFGGFWKPVPYLEMISGFHYPDNKVFLKQHTIIDEDDQVNNYRFWTHYFKADEVFEILSRKGFTLSENFENILPARDVWDGENVTFYKAQK